MRRVWLIVLSLASLVVLVYAGVFTAFSVPVTDEMERANRLGDAASPSADERALVVPITDPTTVETQRAKNDGGALLLSGVTDSGFPSGARDAALARALAYVSPTANGTYVPPVIEFVDVTFPGEDGPTKRNLSVEVAPLAQGRAGFIVKGDAEDAPSFVATPDVLGVVPRFEPSSMVFTLFFAGGLGFALPLIAIIVTHRASGRPGIGTVAAGMCPECRAPMGAKDEFCTRCGAWSRHAPKKEDAKP